MLLESGKYPRKAQDKSWEGYKMKTKGFSFGGIGDLHGAKLGVFAARQRAKEKMDILEKIADEVSADLSDPDQFRICQGLAAKS